MKHGTIVKFKNPPQMLMEIICLSEANWASGQATPLIWFYVVI